MNKLLPFMDRYVGIFIGDDGDTRVVCQGNDKDEVSNKLSRYTMNATRKSGGWVFDLLTRKCVCVQQDAFN